MNSAVSFVPSQAQLKLRQLCEFINNDARLPLWPRQRILLQQQICRDVSFGVNMVHSAMLRLSAVLLLPESVFA